MFSRKEVIVECAASRTALGIFSLHRGRLRLERHFVEKLPPPAGDADCWLEYTQAALAALGRQVKATGPVTLVLPPHLVLTKMTRLPPVEPAKRGQVLRFEAEQGIPESLAEVVWDTVVSAEQEAAVEVMLAAAKRRPVEALCAAMRAAGFESRTILPSSLATLAAFRLAQQEPPGEPALVLNLGARSTTMQLVEGQRFLVRTLALGGLDAQRIAGPGGDAREALAARLAQEITRTMLFFRRQDKVGNPTRLVLAGGGVGLAGLGELLASKTKLPVERLGLSGVIETEGGGASTEGEGNAIVLTELAGAAATQLLSGQPVLNLLPQSLREQASRRQRRRRVLAGAAMLVAGALWPLLAERTPPVGTRAVTVASVREMGPPPVEPVVETPRVESAEEPPVVVSESLDIKIQPPLKLAGYFGVPGNYTVAFVRPGRPETLLARIGGRIGGLGLVLQGFEVRRITTEDREGRPAHDVAAVAVIHDAETGREVVLDSHQRMPSELRTGLVAHNP